MVPQRADHTSVPSADGSPVSVEVGLTSTIPVEIILAGGHRPVDLNNILVTDPDAAQLVQQAETEGYPRNACAWVKGIYSIILRQDIRTVVVVTQGDCSQMQAMMETLADRDIHFLPFAYPYDRDPAAMQTQMERLMELCGTDWQSAVAMQQRLRPLRAKVAQLDELTWREGTVTGYENHLYQVSCSDFEGNPHAFEARVDALLEQVRHREAGVFRARIGVLGVPPIFTDLYQYLDELGVLVAYNEMQRQFTMAPSLDCDLLTQYLRYTYPYDIYLRMEDIQAETAARRLDGLIHYVQSFCFRQIFDHVLRRNMDCPVLTLEGDRPGPLTARDKLRLEAFAETLEARRSVYQ